MGLPVRKIKESYYNRLVYQLFSMNLNKKPIDQLFVNLFFVFLFCSFNKTKCMKLFFLARTVKLCPLLDSTNIPLILVNI